LTRRLTLALLLAGTVQSALAQGQVSHVPPAPVEYYRSNIGHTGVAAENLSVPLSLLWRHTTSSAKNNAASAVYANSTVFFTSGNSVYAVQSADGTLIWKYPVGSKAERNFATTPTLSNGALYVVDDTGQVSKLDALTGNELWTLKLDGAIRSSPVISDGILYFGSGNSHCYAVSADTGKIIWDVTTDGAITTSPIVTGGLVVFSSADNNLYSLSALTGRKAWSRPFDADPSVFPLVYDGQTIFVTSGDTIYELDPSNGSQRSKITLPTNLADPPTINVNSQYVITQTNDLYKLTLAGTTLWHTALTGAATAPPLLAGNLLLAATQPGILSGYDASSGKLIWQYVMQATGNDYQPKYRETNLTAPPIVAGGTLYVVTSDGTLSAFRSDAADNIGPSFLQLVPLSGTSVTNSGLSYGAYVVDEGSGIDPASVSLTLDGQIDDKAQYSPGMNAIYEAAPSALDPGEHHITVKAADWRGNQSTKSWSFQVNDQPTPVTTPGTLNPNSPNYPGGGRNPNAPPPPPPIVPF